jgi:glycosyltransferase involved in cell wall biosynthesis
MHLIVLENDPSSQRGGQELSLLDVCRSLHQRGHQISLFYTKSGDLLPHYQAFCQNTIALKAYKFNKANGLNALTSLYQAMRIVSAFENSLVYTNNYQDSLFGRSLAFLNQIPFVCHLRLPFPKTLGIQAKLGLSGATQLIAVSNQTQDTWVKAGFPASQLNVVHNGIRLERFSPAIDRSAAKQAFNLPSDATTLCYVGRLDKVKGIETLFHAFAQLLNQSGQLHLLVAGKPLIQQPTYLETLKQLTVKLGIDPQVTFWGHVADSTTVYQASDLAVLPSIWSEPFSRTLLESMACGVPMVGSRTGGSPEVLTGEFASCLFEAGDVIHLAQTLQRFLDWRDRDPGLGQRCRQHIADRFSLERAVDQIEQILLKTLD